jgi:hypothetical protein
MKERANAVTALRAGPREARAWRTFTSYGVTMACVSLTAITAPDASRCFHL